MSDNAEEICVESGWDEAKVEVEKAWAEVFKLVNTIVSTHDRFGYRLIGSRINPRFPDILLSLDLMDSMMDALLKISDIDYETSRLVLNAKQQINRVERVVTALKHRRKSDYEAAMAELRRQAQF